MSSAFHYSKMFKPIPQAPQYEISTDGQVRHNHTNGKVNYLKPSFTVYGYRYVTLPGNVKYVIHRLVAQAFIPNPNNLPFVDHINRKRFDNRVCNLRWVSHLDNNRNNEVGRGSVYLKKDIDRRGLQPKVRTAWVAKYASQGKNKMKRFKTKEEAEAHLTIIYFLRKRIRKQWRVNLLQSNQPEQGAQPYHLTTRKRSKEWHIANKQKATKYARKYRAWNKSWDGLNKIDVF